MKISSRWDWVPSLLRVACGFIFIAASIGKLDAAGEFSKLVSAYQLLPVALVPITSVVIPWVEFIAGLSLALGFRFRGSALIFCGLMAFYALAIAFNLMRGIDMSCGCFSMDEKDPATWWTVLRDAVFFAMGWVALKAESASKASVEKLLKH